MPSTYSITQNLLLEIPKQVARTGVYGAAMENGKILLIRQSHGPYADRFDFPGGGIEFGETPEEALRREFAEEIAMSFDLMTLANNLTASVEILATAEKPAYTFFQIGMIYRVEALRAFKGDLEAEFQPFWVDVKNLKEEECSKLLWMFISASC